MFDVVLVTEDGARTRFGPFGTLEEAERWICANAEHFDGHLVVAQHGERVE